MFLLSFTAAVEGDAILPAWEAAHEVDTLGFNLNRADSPDGAQAKLSGALITGQAMPGSTCGAACQWLDQWQLNPGQPYCNWLEDLDIHGEAMLHRPVQAIAGTAVSSLWVYLLLVGQPP